MCRRFLITTPIYYVNGAPHIGHAYTNVVVDAFSRFRKLLGSQVLSVTGTDEHGDKVKRSAAKIGLDVKDFADKISREFKDFSEKVGMNYDLFMRTTSDDHRRSVLLLWKKLVDKGDIYLGKYSGWYSVRDEAFYKESDLEGGKAPTGADVEWIEEESYFFRLSKYGDALLNFYNKNPEFIIPNSRLNELLSFVQSGLEDISVSRLGCEWGIPVPGDEKHTIYVWFDALVIYLTACGFSGGKEFIWGELERIHVMGKDILRFHGVFWLAFLIASDLPLPHKLVVHGWWTNGGQKMSKSLGNIVSPSAMIDKYGKEYFRYFLLKEIRLGNDGDFSESLLMERVNADLANNMGNLFRRVMKVLERKGVESMLSSGLIEKDFVQEVELQVDDYVKCMCEFNMQGALDRLLLMSSRANEYVNIERIWELEGEKLSDKASRLVFVLRVINLCLVPFLPDAATLTLCILGIKDVKTLGFDIKKMGDFDEFPLEKSPEELPIILPRL